jgi:hypothetical protein
MAREYTKNAPSVRKMRPPHATEGYNSLTKETKEFKPSEERKEGEETKGAQYNGWHAPIQEPVQEYRAVDRKVHANATEGRGREKKRLEYEEQLRVTQTVSLPLDPTHDASREGGEENDSPIDDSGWEVIDYPNGHV